MPSLTQKPPLVESPIAWRNPETGQEETFPVHESMARSLEAAMKEFPPDSDRQYTRRSIATERLQLPFDDMSDLWDVSILTRESPDDQNEVVLLDGINVKSFREFPMVSLQHSYKFPPQEGMFGWAGRNEWTKPNGILYIGKTLYPRVPGMWKSDLHGKWLPEIVYMMVASGMLPGNSLGFYPKSIRRPTADEIKLKGWLPDTKVYTAVELVEYAKCGKPVHRGAYTQEVKKSYTENIGDDPVTRLAWEAVTSQPWSAEPVVKADETPPPDPPRPQPKESPKPPPIEKPPETPRAIRFMPLEELHKEARRTADRNVDRMRMVINRAIAGKTGRV